MRPVMSIGGHSEDTAKTPHITWQSTVSGGRALARCWAPARGDVGAHDDHAARWKGHDGSRSQRDVRRRELIGRAAVHQDAIVATPRKLRQRDLERVVASVEP